MECRNQLKKITLKGKNNPNWKGGTRERQGYIQVKADGSPVADKRGYAHQHRLVMSEFIGRPLEKGEVVHHRDGNRHNNDISNLMLLTISDHVRLHLGVLSEKEVTDRARPSD